MTAEFETADVREVFRAIGDRAGVRIDVDLEVSGTITMWLYDVPWRDALKASADALGHVVIEEPGGTLRVAATGRAAAHSASRR